MPTIIEKGCAVAVYVVPPVRLVFDSPIKSEYNVIVGRGLAPATNEETNMPKCVISYSPIGYKLEVPAKAHSPEEVCKIADEVKYLNWRLRKASRPIAELGQLERARYLLEGHKIGVDEGDFTRAVEALGVEIVTAFNESK